MHRADGDPIAVSEDQTVADLVVRHPQLRERLEQFGIDYCCGGKRPLGRGRGDRARMAGVCGDAERVIEGKLADDEMQALHASAAVITASLAELDLEGPPRSQFRMKHSQRSDRR